MQNYSCFWPGFKSCNKCVGGGLGCLQGRVGGTHHKNQLNVLPFPPTETDILHIIAPSVRGCISSIL